MIAIASMANAIDRYANTLLREKQVMISLAPPIAGRIIT